MEIETGSTPSHEVDSNLVESSSRVREKVDPTWEHFSLGADEKGRNTFTCVYCRQTYKVNSVYYQRMIDAVAAAGPGYKGPSYHAVRVPLLRDQKKEVQLLVDSQRRHWAEVGCTLMDDGWTDTRHRLARESKAKEAIAIILDNSFWDDINVLVKISSPLICLLRIVDSDQRTAIGYVYEGMHRARLGIKKISE
ncbi:hypothetical protein SO802_005951 [Lithocarpus litseifolius]|uniref:DUF659 domain-containing protein n=1 Tax=Lithocarpus litseifolius TaxID=425828 RepID=A0AAW2DME6_9ROSI